MKNSNKNIEKKYKTLKFPIKLVLHFDKLVTKNPEWGFNLESQLMLHVLRQFAMEHPVD